MRFAGIFSIALATVCLMCAFATAREADGTLGLIQTPNNGVPALITPGGRFEARLSEKATLTLTKDGNLWPLVTEWTHLPGGFAQARCNTQGNLPPGTYALHAVTGDAQDCNVRAVFVLTAIPDSYLIAHITDTHIGSTRHPREAASIMNDIIAAANKSEAAFALITGDLTENGSPEQFRRFLEVLDTCILPTFVVPGNHDRTSRNYEQFFGPRTYVFQFGVDGYLGYDTKDFLIADELGPQDGLLHYYRRQIRASRWSVGFTHRYDLMMGMRAQLILFVDDPLDYLLYGHYHREADEQDGIPWGRTRIIMTPAAINGQMRFIQVDAQGLHMQETVHAASTLHEQEDN
ncbi:MAG TPA: metallophosphoesterase [Candidatus Hydrogenedentes bacterium]|nr:metallophosphoesterase [Candidatus Hydrogenedentota bacterium]